MLTILISITLINGFQIKNYLSGNKKKHKIKMESIDNEKLIFFKTNEDRTVDEAERDRILGLVNNKDEKVTLVNVTENPYGFFSYLKITKARSAMERISSVDGYRDTLKPVRYFNLLSFRIYICELVYNAINLFPEISEYTITAKNDHGTSTLKFGLFQELTDDGHLAMGVFKSNFDNESFYLRLEDIKSLYMANRHTDVDHTTVTTVIVSMYMCGSLPVVSVDYKHNPEYFKDKISIK